MITVHSPSPLAGLLGHPTERRVETHDVVVLVTRVTQDHQVRVIRLVTHSAGGQAGIV